MVNVTVWPGRTTAGSSGTPLTLNVPPAAMLLTVPWFAPRLVITNVAELIWLWAGFVTFTVVSGKMMVPSSKIEV